MRIEQKKDRLYFIELDAAISFSRYKPLLKLLSAEKQIRIKNFHFEMDKKLSVVSDLFVRHLACNCLNVKNSELKFETNDYGKPYIVDTQEFHYNVSHTRNAIVVGISQTPIGVDVEKICHYDRGVAKRFFCENEVRYIENDNENVLQRFYEVWTKKEAYVKWIGKGLSIPLKSFDVFTNEINRHLKSFQKEDYMTSVYKTGNRCLDFCSDIKEMSLYDKISHLC